MCQVILNRVGKFNLSKRPETYKTLLKDKYGKNSLSTSTRRKISSLIKYGFICSKPINYSEKEYGRETIFYTLEKEYFIVFTTTSVFYCENINTKSDKLELINSYELNCVDWIERSTKFLNLEEVIICF